MGMTTKYGTLPDGVRKYRETKVFTEQTIPPGFRREHSTKAGVWGKICVVRGTLDLKVYEPSFLEIQLSQGELAIVSPQQTHSVSLGDGAAFKVEFYSGDET